MASFILALKLNTEKYQADALNKRFETGRRMYNQIVAEGLKRKRRMQQSKGYRQAMAHYHQTVKDTPERGEAIALLSGIRQDFGLTEYALHEAVTPIKHHYQPLFDINTAQKLASRAWKAFEKVLFSTGKKVHYKKFGQLNSLEGKTNKSGIRYKDGTVIWGALCIPVQLRKKDYYAHKALQNKVKYVRLLRKVVGMHYAYYVQLVLDGIPPQKGRNYALNKARVGIDPGTTTMAIVSEHGAHLVELAPQVGNYNQTIRLLQLKLDRSRRCTNPENYNADGTLKKGVRLIWARSKHYLKLLFKLKNMYRRKAVYIKQSHLALIHRILQEGTIIYTETMQYKGLAKRSTKPTEYNPKTGKCKRKKRFGKTLNDRAPAQFLTLLDTKLGYMNKKLKKINTYTFKASQYCHADDSYVKKSLSQRWQQVGNDRLQRDLYSAFLLMNSQSNLQKTNRKLCLQTYKPFKVNHDLCLNRVAKLERAPKSFGLKHFNGYTSV